MACLPQGIAGKVVVEQAAAHDIMVVVTVAVVLVAAVVGVVHMLVVQTFGFVVVVQANLVGKAVAALSTHVIASADSHGSQGGYKSALPGLMMQTFHDQPDSCAERKDCYSAQLHMNVVFEVGLDGDESCFLGDKFHS